MDTEDIVKRFVALKKRVEKITEIQSELNVIHEENEILKQIIYLYELTDLKINPATLREIMRLKEKIKDPEFAERLEKRKKTVEYSLKSARHAREQRKREYLDRKANNPDIEKRIAENKARMHRILYENGN